MSSHFGSRRSVLLVATTLAFLLIATHLAWAVVQGNVNPDRIEVDQSSGDKGANLFPGSTTCADTFPTTGGGVDLDWVKDCAVNTDSATLSAQGIASGLLAGVTSASPRCTAATPANQLDACARGHWNGLRLVDGIGTNDGDIFIKGGKENSPSAWNVGPGSVGSSKYDATQMYLANNQTDLYLGMERSGNNGTTAFDFEFNKAAPTCNETKCYIPTRSEDDVLWTFEMQGSPNSGSATAYYFKYHNGAFVLQGSLPAGTLATINDLTNTPGEPWGHVNDKGDWVLGPLDKYTFAEAKVPLSSLIPGTTAQCAGSDFVSIRTRSSSTDTSDLKDAFPIFEYNFGSPDAAAAVASACASTSTNNGNPTFTFSGAGSKNSGGGSTGLTYTWTIKAPCTLTLSAVTIGLTLTAGTPCGATDTERTWTTNNVASGEVLANLSGASLTSALIKVKNSIAEGIGTGCSDDSDEVQINVYRALGVTNSVTPHCDGSFDFSSTASGGKAPYTYSWTIEKETATPGTFAPFSSGTYTAGSATSASGTYQPGVGGKFRAKVTVTDTAGVDSTGVDEKPACTATATSSAFDVRPTLGATIAKGSSPTLSDADQSKWYATVSSTTTYSDTVTYAWEKCVSDCGATGSGWTSTGTNSATLNFSSFADATAADLSSTFTIGSGNGAGTYAGKVWTVMIRLTVTRVLNGGTSQQISCTATSNVVTLKKIIAIDP